MNRLKQFLAAPVFPDEEKTRAVALINSMALTTLGTMLVFVLILIAAKGIRSFFEDATSLSTFVATFVAALLVRYWARLGHTRSTGAVLTLSLAAVSLVSNYYYGGITNSTTALYIVSIIIAGLLLGRWGAILTTALSVACVLALWYIELTIGLPEYHEDPQRIFDIIAISGIFTMAGLLLQYAVHNKSQALERARHNERAQIEANRQLEALRASLEQQVAERTRALQRRTAQLQAAAEVEHTAATILETEQLAQRVVRALRGQFELYYAGLFLVDETNEWAVLQAGSGKTGQDLLARGYRVRLDSDSIISRSIAAARTNVVAETGRDALVRSGAVLPLQSRERALGAILVYSDQADAFDQDTLTMLETVAAQVAASLDNAYLFAQSQKALEAARRAYGELSRQAWSELARARPYLNLRRDQKGVAPAGGARPPQLETALQTGRPAAQDDTLAAPIQVRQQVIGAISARKPGGAGKWTQEQIALMQTLADQLGVALESARLFQETQQRAAQEKLIGEVTARLRESLDVDQVLRAAARELGETLGMSEVNIRLVSGEAAQQAS